MNGLKYGATGFLNTDWGDGGHHQILPTSYLGFTAGAGFSWHLKTNKNADFASVISRHFFQDRTGTLGQLCLDMGRILNRIPGLVRGNCSCIHQLLFGNLNKMDLTKVTKTQYKNAEAWISKLEADLLKAKPVSTDKTLVMNEFSHALSVCRYAIHRGQLAQFELGDADTLRSEHQNIIMSHEDQWLARNRRGGLYDSSNRLRNGAKPLIKEEITGTIQST